MQITLNQDELTIAVETYVRSQININDDQDLSIDFTAGRAPNGLSATLNITAPAAAAPTTGKAQASNAGTSSKPRAMPSVKPAIVKPSTPEPEPQPEPEEEPAEAAETPEEEAEAVLGSEPEEAEEEADAAEEEASEVEEEQDEAPAPSRASIFSKKSA